MLLRGQADGPVHETESAAAGIALTWPPNRV